MPEAFANIELMQPVRRRSIRFLIDSKGLGDTPTSKNAFCVYKCTACQVVNIELKVNLNLEKQGKQEETGHKIVYWIGIETLEKD